MTLAVTDEDITGTRKSKQSILRVQVTHNALNASHTNDFIYVYERTHKPVTDKYVMQRIRHLHIPPGYINVVISGCKNDKIQAVGYDTKGRKQTVYAKWFIEKQNKIKFARVMKLEKTIGKIQNHVNKTIREATEWLSKYIYALENKSNNASDILQLKMKTLQICVIVKLMILCNFRIGNRSNAEKYKSYGLTTIEWRHITIYDNTKQIAFSFIGKKGVLNKAVCKDARIFKIITSLHALQTLKYHDATGNMIPHKRIFKVTSYDVNNYLKSFDENISSKDLRTWQANVLFMKYFIKNEENTMSTAKRQMNALRKVAFDLHNTVGVCKKSYIYPELLENSDNLQKIVDN